MGVLVVAATAELIIWRYGWMLLVFCGWRWRCGVPGAVFSEVDPIPLLNLSDHVFSLFPWCVGSVDFFLLTYEISAMDKGHGMPSAKISCVVVTSFFHLLHCRL